MTNNLAKSFNQNTNSISHLHLSFSMCWGQPLISITIREKISSSLLLINFKSWIKVCYIFVLYYYFSNCTFYYVSIIPIDLFIYLLIYFFNLRLYVVNTISFLLQLRSITSNNGVVILIWSYGLLFVYNFWVKEKKGEITVSNGKWRQRSLTWLLSSLLQNLSFSHWHKHFEFFVSGLWSRGRRYYINSKPNLVSPTSLFQTATIFISKPISQPALSQESYRLLSPFSTIPSSSSWMLWSSTFMEFPTPTPTPRLLNRSISYDFVLTMLLLLFNFGLNRLAEI